MANCIRLFRIDSFDNLARIYYTEEIDLITPLPNRRIHISICELG